MNELINLGNGQFVKVIMLKGERGSNIATIAKTGISGLTDTYTVTLTDGSHTTFNVTNGKSIVSIAKTGSYLLTDTYTITYNDGTTSTFTVENGGNSEELNVYHATGDYLELTDTSDGNALAKTIYGMSKQDGTPTPSDPVDIVDAKADFKVVGKNLLAYPWANTTKTDSGVVFTDNGDGSITANGENTTNNNANFWFYSPLSGDLMGLKTGSYKLVTEVLDGSFTMNGQSAIIQTAISYYQGTTWKYQSTNNSQNLATFQIDESSDVYNRIGVVLSIPKNGGKATNLKLKISIVQADVEDTSFESYHSTQIMTDLSLRAIEVTSSDKYNLEVDGHYYVADSLDWSEDRGFELNKRIGSVDLGDFDYGILPSYNAFQTEIPNILNDNYTKPMAISDAFVYFTGSMSQIANGQMRLNQNSANLLNLCCTETSDASQFKTFVTGKKLNYILAVPYTEKITAEQAMGLLSLKTYDTASSIYGISDVKPIIELHYAKSETVARALSGHNEGFKAQELENLYGVKNLLIYPFSETTKTVSGITYTDNGNGSLTMSGTASAQTYFTFIARTSEKLYLRKGHYVLSGIKAPWYINVLKPDNTVIATNNGQQVDSLEFDIKENTYIGIATAISNNTVFTTPITVKPLLRLSSIQSDSFEPYAKSNRELTEDIQTLDAKYLIKSPLYSINYEATSTETVRDVLQGLANALDTFQHALPNDEYFRPESVLIPLGNNEEAFGVVSPCWLLQNNNYLNPLITFKLVSWNTSSNTSVQYEGWLKKGEDCNLLGIQVASSSASVINASTKTIGTVENNPRITGTLYKKISI